MFGYVYFDQLLSAPASVSALGCGMSVESVRNQHVELNRLFEEHYDELSGIESAVRESVKQLVAENDVEEETATWALSSLDIRECFGVSLSGGAL